MGPLKLLTDVTTFNLRLPLFKMGYVLQTLHTTPTAAVIQTSLVLSVRILQRNTSAPLTVSQPERPFATLSPK